MTNQKMRSVLSFTVVLFSAALATGCVEPLDEGDPALAEETFELAAFARSIQNVFTSKCFDIPWGTAQPGAPVNQFTCHGGPAQQFVVEGTPGVPGLVRIRNTSTNKCVTPTGYQGWSTPSMRLVQVSCGSTSNWTLENRSDVAGGIRTGFRWAYDSAYCIDVPGGSSQDSLQLQAFPCHGGPVQVFDVRS